MMNKLTALSQPIVEAKEEKTTHKGGTVTSDEKGSKHKGKYGTAFQGDEDDEKTDVVICLHNIRGFCQRTEAQRGNNRCCQNCFCR